MLRQIVPTEATAIHPRHAHAALESLMPPRRGQLRAGQGILELRRIAGRTAATRIAATAPLKLLAPRRPGHAAWIYTSTYGGGLVAGDEIDLQVRLGPGACGVLGTQSATKVYKSSEGAICRQSLAATVADEALLVVVPDPVICFADARYEQRQRIELQCGRRLGACRLAHQRPPGPRRALVDGTVPHPFGCAARRRARIGRRLAAGSRGWPVGLAVSIRAIPLRRPW